MSLVSSGSLSVSKSNCFMCESLLFCSDHIYTYLYLFTIRRKSILGDSTHHLPSRSLSTMRQFSPHSISIFMPSRCLIYQHTHALSPSLSLSRVCNCKMNCLCREDVTMTSHLRRASAFVCMCQVDTEIKENLVSLLKERRLSLLT